MKKILFLLLTVMAFTACGGGDDPDPNPVQPSFENWNDPANSHYTDGKYNRIKGEWQLSQRNGVAASDFLVYKFDTNFTQSECKTEPAEDKDPTYANSKTYIINDKEYKANNVVYQYAISGTLENATLTIKEGNQTLTFKPYVSKVWKWNGDWNSTSDPHYEIYNGKYNPIKGTWKLTHVGKDAINYSSFYRFNDDFTIEQSTNGNTGFNTKRKYWINDIGIKEDSFTIESYFPSYSHSYTIEGNTLYYRAMLPNKSSGITLIRYK